MSEQYAYKITNHIRDIIKREPENGPITRQYTPSDAENNLAPEELSDPIGDEKHSPVKGIVHRYPDRVLLKISSICAAYCRYCFRKDMIGPNADTLTKSDTEYAINYIRTHTGIWEVILTGGDPFTLSPRRLTTLFDELEAIDHVQILRVHTRMPLSDPARITPALCAALTRKKPLYIVLHVNHVNELTPDVTKALNNLHKAGCVLLSQSVLLKDVNDDAKTLEALFRKLITLRVKPYYLHHLDYAPGTSHFRVSIKQGRAIMKQLLGHVSGLCLPTYMLDIPGGYGKIPLTPDYLSEISTNTYSAQDYQGGSHRYPSK